MLNITDEERRLLDSIFAGSAPEDGTLFAHQQEALKQLRGAAEYLRKKYPSVQTEAKAFDPLTRGNEKGSLHFSASGLRPLFRVVIRYADGEYIYADTLYGGLIKDRYDEALTKRLSAYFENVRTETEFYTPLGLNDDGSMGVDDILHHDPVIVRHTDIYTDICPQISSSLLQVLKAEGWHASYTAWYAKDREEIYHDDLSKSRGAADHISFRVFPGGYYEGEQS